MYACYCMLGLIVQSGHRMQSSSGSHHDMDVSIIDKDETSDKAYHVVDGFVIEDSKQPFPVSTAVHHRSIHCMYYTIQWELSLILIRMYSIFK